jgi:hypothetical protein
MIDWTPVIEVGILAAGFVVVGVAGVVGLRHIGQAAFQSGATPRSADSFVNFFLQSARIATVSVIVMATVILALTKNLNERAIGILSGVAGYVLGGVGHSDRNRPSSQSLAADRPPK